MGVVISKSAAAKFTSYKVEKSQFSVNTNDILINLYGTDDEYKSFPKIGETIHSRVLVALRRRDRRTALYDLQASKMHDPDPVDDDIIYTDGGTIVDINIFNNISLADMRKKTDAFNKEVLEIMENQYRYWKELADVLETIIPCKVLTEKEEAEEKNEFGCVIKHPIEREKNPNKYTDELAYTWKLAHENIDEKISWRYDGKSFDNFKMEFTILKENPLVEGCKLTGRYGNKGIVALIEDDEKMPTTKDGVHADICLNPLGVWNRLNPSQLQEQHLNFMADHVLKEIRQLDNYQDKADLLFEFLKLVNKKQYDYFQIEYMVMNRKEQEKFIADVEEHGIYIHQPPAYGNTTTEQFEKILVEHPEWCTPYEFENIERPMVMGDIYFIRLKHESSNKASVRSSATLNVKNLPSKSTLKKEHRILMSNTPIRLGERFQIAEYKLSKCWNVLYRQSAGVI